MYTKCVSIGYWNNIGKVCWRQNEDANVAWARLRNKAIVAAYMYLLKNWKLSIYGEENLPATWCNRLTDRTQGGHAPSQTCWRAFYLFSRTEQPALEHSSDHCRTLTSVAGQSGVLRGKTSISTRFTVFQLAQVLNVDTKQKRMERASSCNRYRLAG